MRGQGAHLHDRIFDNWQRQVPDLALIWGIKAVLQIYERICRQARGFPLRLKMLELRKQVTAMSPWGKAT